MTDENCAKTVTIIGAGIGGLYLVGELGVAGFKLRLHDIDDSKLSEIRARGGVDVEGERGGFAPVERATTDLEPAIDGADVIIVVTGGNAQVVVARSLVPLLRDGQVILLIRGNTGGSLIVRRAFDDAGCRADVDVAEINNYPYSCWRLSPTRIRPIVRKRWLQIATFPGESHRRGVSASVAVVPGSGRGAEYPVHRLHQRQRDAACGELCRQRRAHRERGQLQILCGRRDAGGRSIIRGD